MKVIFSPDARGYVKSEAEYLNKRSPRAARQFVDSLKRLRQHLTQFPNIGQVTEEIPVAGVLRFVMGSYLVDYELRDNVVLIFAIRHGQQRPPGGVLDDDFDFEDSQLTPPSD
ncbi:MAG: type II toxin-antitoxin system RelE/ParE family toxin [Shinella sp.]|nr:type II toxin-antitoxin system RelE/ParE family toxin [Shinella sp.]